MSIFTNILSWLIFGSVIGGLGYIIEPSLHNKKPFVYGISGAIITGLTTNLILNIPIEQFSLVSFMVAICGACFLIITTGFLRKV
jgi:uncharacterized membrane protein YeaQ/YmgE (transglycosylase-associated protein family)